MQPFQVVNKYKFAHIGDFKGDENSLVKTPTLRNIEETAPYFHNGQIWTLSEAIKEMGSTQLGIEINSKEADKIATFLKSLTGEKPQIVYPILPPSSSKTPKPAMN
jgi:cytochrome c peroxidase